MSDFEQSAEIERVDREKSLAAEIEPWTFEDLVAVMRDVVVQMVPGADPYAPHWTALLEALARVALADRRG